MYCRHIMPGQKLHTIISDDKRAKQLSFIDSIETSKLVSYEASGGFLGVCGTGLSPSRRLPAIDLWFLSVHRRKFLSARSITTLTLTYTQFNSSALQYSRLPSTLTFEIVFYVWHRQMISNSKAKAMIKLPNPDIASCRSPIHHPNPPAPITGQFSN